jgi:glycosyltransferase involved in cell wall biosynthesis
MRVLMISLDGSLLGAEHGDTVQRHLEYARRIGDLRIVVYNSTSQPKEPRQFSEHLTVYPTNCRAPYSYLWRAFRVASQIHHTQPVDMITTQDPFATGLIGALLKWRFKLPLNVQSHSTFFTNPYWIAEHPIRNRIFRLIGKWVIKRATTCRVLTEYEKQVFMKLGIPADRIMVSIVPVHLERFAAPTPPESCQELRQQLNIEPDAPVAVWVGLPVAFKHMDLLLDAFALVHNRLPQARLLLVGDFTKYPQYIQRADSSYVRFAGRVPHDDLPPYYALANLYVHSSYYEGVPRVLMEALASARPVVSTRNIGSQTVVRDGDTGILTDHTPESLAAGLIDLFSDPDRAQAMGAKGQIDALDRFDYERLMAAVIDIYRQTVARP